MLEYSNLHFEVFEVWTEWTWFSVCLEKTFFSIFNKQQLACSLLCHQKCRLINVDYSNQSFSVGIFPDILKIAKVTPLHKKEYKLNFQNYHPISLLSVFSKTFEKTIYTFFVFFFCLFHLFSFTVSWATPWSPIDHAHK